MGRYKFFLLLLILLLVITSSSVWAAPPQQVSVLGTFVFDARADMELLANAVLGEALRPEGWTGNTDLNSSSVYADLWFDNEQLANTVFGDGIRPPEWLGVTSTAPALIARNVRHDLELSADQFFGARTRPPEWRGAAPLLQCDRTLQNIIGLLRDLYRVNISTAESALNYCLTVESESETQLLNQNILIADTEQLKDSTLALRGDLERLADEKLGLNSRPREWIGNKDRESATLIGDNFLDLETLATGVLGSNERPETWLGVVTNSPLISYRNLRHDLELLADRSLGFNLRPRGWQGLNPLERCEPLVQDLVFVVQANYGLETETLPLENFCAAVSDAANQLAEAPRVESEVVAQIDSRYLGESESAFTYLDVSASQFMGIMPLGTKFRAWYRNFAESSMMFVSGDDFAVFLDRRWTTVSEDTFASLPSLEGVAPLTFCDAIWCNGPGPTPTPTGSGALALLLAENTPQAPPSQDEVSTKTQVSWNNVRVTYLQDNSQTRTAQVALEICAEPAQITCEPVIRVFDNAAGALKPVLSQYNSLNVYEFTYGYSSNLLIEGATLTSPDVWISDPSIR